LVVDIGDLSIYLAARSSYLAALAIYLAACPIYVGDCAVYVDDRRLSRSRLGESYPAKSAT